MAVLEVTDLTKIYGEGESEVVALNHVSHIRLSKNR